MEETILLVDDDAALLEVTSIVLASEGYRVLTAEDGIEALRILGRERLDLVVLDIMLPGTDGLTILRQLRAEGRIPVILLTARADEVDRVVGLELGADDYVVKPFSPRELAARVRNVLRRATPPAVADAERPIEHGTLRIDPATREVHVDGRLVALTPKEFDLLLALVRRRGAVASRLELLKEVWGHQAEVMTRTVDIHIAELRRKLEDDPSTPRHILTVWKAGYRLQA